MGAAARSNPFNQWKQTTQPTVYDAYDEWGRAIGVGDYVILAQHGAVMWRVVQTRPVMNPQAPAGIVELTLTAVTALGIAGGQPQPGLIKVRDAGEYLTEEQLAKFKAEVRGGGPTGETPPADPPADPPDAPPDGSSDALVGEVPPEAPPSRIIVP
jgi:hypothetical protein